MSHILNLIYWFSKQILNSHGLRFAGVKIAKVDNGFVSRNILGVCKQNQTVPAAHLSHKLWNTTTLSSVLLLSLPISWRSQHSPRLLSTFLERAVLCDLLTQSTLRFFFLSFCCCSPPHLWWMKHYCHQWHLHTSLYKSTRRWVKQISTLWAAWWVGVCVYSLGTHCWGFVNSYFCPLFSRSLELDCHDIWYRRVERAEAEQNRITAPSATPFISNRRRTVWPGLSGHVLPPQGPSSH